MVFFHHICFASIQSTTWPPSILLLHTISEPGRYGVDLFFVLSGFLITSLLIGARKESSYYHDFYWKRALRILPLYLVCLLGIFLFIPGSGSYVFLSAFFLANFSSIFHIGASGPFWTLAIEEQFYLLWPTVVRLHSVTQIRHWAVATGTTAFLLRLIAASFGHFDYNFTFFHCDGLAFGAFLACWYSQRNPDTSNLKSENRATAFGFALGIAMVALPVFGSQAWEIAFRAAFQQTGVTLLCGSIVAFIIIHSGRRSMSFLRSAPLTFFGLISYAMYMVHAYVMNEYDSIRGPLAAGNVFAYTLRFFSVLGITIALCLASRYLIELPAMSLRRFVLARPSPLASGEPPLPLGNM
jgi:peptidoglycan/LPS O-acetylase OafA/YrhL